MRFLKEIRKLVSMQPGFVVDRIVEGKHYKLFMTTPSGPQIMVVSRSASDHRAIENAKQLLRSWK